MLIYKLTRLTKCISIWNASPVVAGEHISIHGAVCMCDESADERHLLAGIARDVDGHIARQGCILEACEAHLTISINNTIILR